MKYLSDKFVLAPTDLSNFLGCRHLVSLDLDAARGETARPVRRDALMEELRARGHRHERAYLKHLREQGLTIAGDDAGNDDEQSACLGPDETLDAMRAGVDVVYQAPLESEVWSGRVDFLGRVDTPSDLGPWSYEVFDTKLARETKAETILQLCVYSHLLGTLQRTRPQKMHVVTPGTDFEPESYRIDEYAAYFRLLERGIGAFVGEPGDTYPELVSNCDYCAWWSRCETRRRGDDHLCYVAGISRLQMTSLRDLGVESLSELGALDPVPKPRRGSRDALVRVRAQARVQEIARERGTPYFELRHPFDPVHGLSLLPEPTPDDIFLDFEGDHFAESGVREYLLGYVTRGSGGEPVYTPHWARTHEEERAAFERFIDAATEIRRRSPGAHIYHFAPYEPAALKRLMGRYATREVELDQLLRARSLVDLHAVVKRALIAGVERYSIKDLEPYFGYGREQDLREAAMSRRIVESAIAERGVDEAVDPHVRVVEDYNREDCESAARLRDWLEQIRDEVIAEGGNLPRPEPQDGDASEAISELDEELERLRNGLLDGVPDNPEERSEAEQGRFVLAHMMEFHRREEKASWWEYFRLQDLEETDLADERRVIAGLEHVQTLDPKAAPLERYRFSPQELDARSGDDVHGLDGKKLGSVEAVEFAERTVDIKKRKDAADLHPRSCVLHARVSSRPLPGWRDKNEQVRSLTADDILVVARYNAQVSALAESLPELSDRIGTVDRFQGQEAPVVIYSMTSSSPEDAPRGMEFLYNRFRFNVATSRARALCILVGSPALFEPECRTPHQMRMANGLCRFRELSRTTQVT